MTKTMRSYLVIALLLSAGLLLASSPASDPPGEPAIAQADTTIYLPFFTMTSTPRTPVLKWQRGGCFSSWPTFRTPGIKKLVFSKKLTMSQ
jgi:hypothetical protein